MNASPRIVPGKRYAGVRGDSSIPIQGLWPVDEERPYPKTGLAIPERHFKSGVKNLLIANGGPETAVT